MAQSKGSNSQNQKDPLDTDINSFLGENQLFDDLNDRYSSIYLLSEDKVDWRELENFEQFGDLEYRGEYTEEGSMVVLFPDFIDVNQDEDVMELTEEILEDGVEGIVVPSYAVGSPATPPPVDDLVEGFWGQDGYKARALLYETQSK